MQNGALAGTDFDGKPVEEVLANLSSLPAAQQTVYARAKDIGLAALGQWQKAA